MYLIYIKNNQTKIFHFLHPKSISHLSYNYNYINIWTIGPNLLNHSVSVAEVLLGWSVDFILKKEVPLISSADALQISSEEYQSLDDVVVVSTEPVQKDGSEFMAVGANIQSSDEALNIYKKTSIDPYAASCDSRILIYRFCDQSGKTIENYHDDREHGAGRRMLRYLQDNRINDVAIVLTRWMGRSHIGPARFSIMENLVCDLVNKLDDPSDAGK